MVVVLVLKKGWEVGCCDGWGCEVGLFEGCVVGWQDGCIVGWFDGWLDGCWLGWFVDSNYKS